MMEMRSYTFLLKMLAGVLMGKLPSENNVLRRVPLIEQELSTLPEHLSSPRFLVGFVLLDL